MLQFDLNEFHFCVGIYQQVLSERHDMNAVFSVDSPQKCTQQT